MRSRECGLVDCLNALAAPPNALAAPASADVEKTMTGGRSGEDADPVYTRAKSRLSKELMNSEHQLY